MCYLRIFMLRRERIMLYWAVDLAGRHQAHSLWRLRWVHGHRCNMEHTNSHILHQRGTIIVVGYGWRKCALRLDLLVVQCLLRRGIHRHRLMYTGLICPEAPR